MTGPDTSRRGDIELAGVCKQYDGHTAVDGVNLRIADGAYCCFLGPSGCGKTTILRMIAGHEDPTDGEILIGGDPVVGLPPTERRTSMMFQSYALFPHLSVRENIAFPLRVRKLSAAQREQQAGAMMEKVRISELADRLPAQLSGGQQQRVALARAAITEPRVLLLDEPLSALDEQLRIQMRQELRRMQRELGITFIHVTHTQLEAIALADQVVVMENGRIKQSGPAREIYAVPKDRYVAEFVGGQNVLACRVERVNGHQAWLGATSVAGIQVPLDGVRGLTAGDRVDIAVRRDDLRLHRADASHALPPGRSAVQAAVTAVEYQGYFVKVMLEVSDGAELVAYLPEREFFAEPFTLGDAVVATWPAEHSLLLA